MHHYDLGVFLTGHVFAFMLIFTRIGAVIMLFPGVGEPYVPPRARMMLAFTISVLLLEPLFGHLPTLPPSVAETGRLILSEMFIGLLFGTLVRMAFGALESAGMLIGLQSGLSNATMLNPALATQSPLPSAFLSTAGLVLIFLTGLDHFLLRAMVGLYDVFPVGGELMIGDAAQTVMHTANRSFAIGIELAAPFLIMGMLLLTALGIMQRLMPSVQIFMLSMPMQIWGGLALFSLTSTAILTGWMHYFDEAVATFFQN